MPKIKISKESADQQKNNVDFNELFREYFKPLCAYCQFKFGLDIEEAKDNVHSGFINLLESDFIFSSLYLIFSASFFLSFSYFLIFASLILETLSSLTLIH